MKKTYIEARFRIEDVVFNTGYICIEGHSIVGLFTLDCVIIDINNNIINLFLFEYNSMTGNYFESELFTCKYNLEYLESPATYFLNSDSNETLKFELIKKVTDKNIISILDEQFNVASND